MNPSILSSSPKKDHKALILPHATLSEFNQLDVCANSESLSNHDVRLLLEDRP